MALAADRGYSLISGQGTFLWDLENLTVFPAAGMDSFFSGHSLSSFSLNQRSFSF
jgi:hypothetical protein